MTARTYTLESLTSYNDFLLSLHDNEKRRVLDHLDYSSFSNFITLGSAEFEVNLSISQILNNYPTFEKFGVSSNNLSITTNDEIVSEYLSWKFKSTPFSEYFANDICNETISATITGALYASSSSDSYTITFPYFSRLIGKESYFTDNTVLSNISSGSISAEEFDKYNMNMICNFLPDVMTIKDEEFDTLIRAIGKELDFLYYSIKDMNSMYSGEYKINKLPNDIILNQFIDSLGFTRVYDFIDSNITNYYQPISEDLYSRKDLSRYFKAAFVNNIMNVIKTKGTKESINILKNIFAGPDNLLRINEYVTVSDKIPSTGLTYHNGYYDTITIQQKTTVSPARYVVMPSDYSGSKDPGLTTLHFKYPAFFHLKNGTLNATISDLEALTFTYNLGSETVKFRIDEGTKSFGMSSSASLFPLSSSEFNYVTPDSVFMFAYDPKNKYVYIGYYNENTSYSYDSVTSNHVGKVYSLTAFYDNKMPNKFYSLIIDFHNENVSEKNFDILGIKTFEEDIDFNALSSMTMNYNLINYKGKTPTHGGKKANIKNSSQSIDEYIDSINGENAIATTFVSNISDLKTIGVIKAEEVNFSSGEMIDPIGIYVDDNQENISNYLLANNKLKIEISPINTINEFIKNLLNIYNFDEISGNPDDFYKPNNSKLKELRQIVYAFLSNYSEDIDIQSFFNILKTQYSENIIKFIIEYLIPAKSSVEGGIVVQNDILDDSKYAGKPIDCDEINKEDCVYKSILEQSDILDDPVQLGKNILNTASENSLNSQKLLTNAIDSSDGCLNVQDNINQINLLSTILDDQTSYENNIKQESDIVEQNDTEMKNIVKNMSDYTYENKYIDLGKGSNNNSQGNETDINSITGFFKFGTSPSNIKGSISDAFEEKIAHSELSELNLSGNKNELNESETGTLNIRLDRFGNETPNGIVKLVVPTRAENDNEPIISFLNLNSTSGDLYYPSITSAKEIYVKLDNKGYRSLDYCLNIPSLSLSTLQNAYTTIDFGNLGPSSTSVTMNITSSDEFSNEKGNLLSFVIEEDSSMQTSYAKCEIIKNKIIKLSVIEVPYVVYNIIDALTSNTKINNFVSLNLSDLYSARNSSTSDSEGMSKTVGEFFLNNGTGNLSTIKNKEYKIQTINIYNNKQQTFSLIPRVYTIAKDENEKLKEII